MREYVRKVCRQKFKKKPPKHKRWQIRVTIKQIAMTVLSLLLIG